MMQDIEAIKHWVAILSEKEIPVLRQTARELTSLLEDEANLNAQSTANVIARDPLMTVKLLRYLQQHKHRAQTTEIMQVEQALLMLGTESFYKNVASQPLAEEILKSHTSSLVQLLGVVHRSHRASEYAKNWAVQLHDLHYEEVRVAALLHDIAEILMWCFAPTQMQEMHNIQKNNKSLRSRSVQEQVFGFSLFELQKELATQWKLPGLLLTLMNDTGEQHPRLLNVSLAVNLARHSANGWDDSALPDDFEGIGKLLRIPAAQVMADLAEEAGIACDIGKPH